MKKWTEPPFSKVRAVTLFLAVAAIAAPTGCGPGGEAAVVPEGAGTAPTSTGSIMVRLHRYLESGASQPYEELGITALFPRYQPADETLVDTLLGERVPEIDVAIDQCEAATPLVPLRPRRLAPADGATIELADVGNLSVEFAGERITLPTQTFPDLLHVIDGVTYVADERSGLRFDPAESYTVHASGTDEVARFDVVLDAPEDLGEVTIDGVSPADQTPIVRRGAPIAIAWEGGGGYGDEVIATIRWSGMGLPQSISCRMRDDGLFVVPGDATAALQDPLVSGEAEMTVSRVRQTAFRAKGLASADLSFVLSTSFLVRFDAVP
ncbi:MAG: hypothetical protein M0R80_00095 [Proteobacteria bacterium]|nr:hypothetical protein [Pseudomonadota bacterium]